ncbi:unannotated protein [freshwater metagenome]|uniref:Unannotated protein n=1 Tax=freshwater metagenome TaxID=449393 RepID=A0A6J6MZT3_9ZZZZ
MKTLAKIKKREFKLPVWVKTKVIAPFVLICVFLTGAFFQLNFPLFKKPETPVEYNSATLTAHEKWQIEQDTCESMRKIYGFIENETVSPEEVLALARVEQKVTAQVLKTWNDHAEGKKLSDDWYANATEVWASIIDITESYPYRNEPWLAEVYPRLANVDEFKKYLVYGIESPANDTSVLWMVVLKRCVYASEEPAVVAPVVKKSATDSSYCPIYADFKNLNFNRPELAAVWAQNNLRTVNQLGQKSNSYTQLESSMSGLLSSFTDVQLTMPNQQQVDAFLNRAPLQILTNRLDLLCGA